MQPCERDLDSARLGPPIDRQTVKHDQVEGLGLPTAAESSVRSGYRSVISRLLRVFKSETAAVQRGKGGGVSLRVCFHWFTLQHTISPKPGGGVTVNV